MFWRKRKSREKSLDGAGGCPAANRRNRRLHQVEFGSGMFALTLPRGTVVEEHGPGVGSFSPPDAAGDFIFSISSYDIELYGLQDRRPAEAALGEGEALGPVSARAPAADDYETIHDVAADDGPYAEFGGYLMRLWRHEDRYLRAFRIAVTDKRDLERARDFLSGPWVARTSTAIDLDQSGWNANLVVLGGHFHMTLPSGWTAHLDDDEDDEDDEDDAAEDQDDDDDGSERFYGLSADQRLLLEVKVVEQWAEEPQGPEKIADLLVAHTEVELSLMKERGQSGTVLVLDEGFRLIATDDLRGSGGRRQRLYTAEGLARTHRVYAHYWLTTLIDDMEDAEWQSAVQKVEPAVRGAHIYHPCRFIVGEDD